MVIKQGMIYRSADLSRLTQQDILTFSTLGIQTICSHDEFISGVKRTNSTPAWCAAS
ncbi:tyrosine-protein phosphatase [Bacillus aerius]|uniref:tyrosine-protein phosphatase n=1 Tax=Bacillus aerius TaxID=293388 RepID=UPI00281628EB|nr:tyrosine-protein phosphatase [Bacillus aerius]WMT27611.1 tyrosine-protein phosphatase [Bacillus aerius]